MNNYFKTWKKELSAHFKLICASLFLLILATVINYNAGQYVLTAGTGVVNDFVLDNVAPVDLTFIFVYVWLAVIALMFIYPVIFKVDKIHRIITHFSFITIVRSFFITLTHLKTPIDAVPVNFPGPLSTIAFQNDLFFSGHTAIPFMAFLVYKGDNIRWVFLAASIIMASTVLLMHQHYTIDVLAAYFITFGTYKFGRWLFSVADK